MFNSLSSFQISTENVVHKKRRSIGEVYPERHRRSLDSSIDSRVSSEELGKSNETAVMADEQILTILGDLACYKDQLLDCLDLDIRNLRSITEFDELKKEVKDLKANILKSSTKLKYLKENEDRSEYTTLIKRSKDLLIMLEIQRVDLLNNETKKQDDQIFSHVTALKASLDVTLKSCIGKFTVNWRNIEDGELIMLSDNISCIRDSFNDLNKLYFEFIEKCPPHYPAKDALFTEYNIKMKDTENKKTSYEADIIKEMQARELTRNKIQDIKNEIKLPVFQGYGAELDFYTFKSRFLNKYRRYTSRDMFDILKNTYLKGEAYNTVKELDDLNEIWERLKKDFGNPSRMLKGKLSDILGIGSFTKIKGITEKTEAVLKTINLLSDIFKLADEHDLHLELYCKNEKVLGQMLKQLPRLWLHDWQALKKKSKGEIEQKLIGSPAWKEDQLYWELFRTFLKEQYDNLKEEESIDEALKEISVSDDKTNGAKASIKSSHLCDTGKVLMGVDNEDDYYEEEFFNDEKFSHTVQKTPGESLCKLCDSPAHNHYWDCQGFMKMKHGERFELFVNPRRNNATPKPHIGKLLGECASCLVPNAKFGHKCHENNSVKKWLCQGTHQKPVHILCCRHHIDLNEKLWEEFHFNELIPAWKREMKWRINIKNSSHSNASLLVHESDENTLEKPVREEGLFLFQKVAVDEGVYNVFYDSGCGDFCVSKSAVDRLGDRANKINTGAFQVVGVGNMKSEVKHGVYEVRLPLANSNEALFAGLCMDEVTTKFCEYNITPLYDELAKDFVKQGGDMKDFPVVSRTGICGGETDIMVGIKYNRYLPTKVHQLECGLAIYQSAFQGRDGSTAVIGGPHPLISEIEWDYAQRNKTFTAKGVASYFSKQLKLYLDGYDISPGSRLSVWKQTEVGHYLAKSYNRFTECEDAGTFANYRCIKCRDCKDCKCGPLIEEVSRKEEREQHFINESVKFNENENRVECVLPLLEDPSKVLGDNKKNASKIYHRWIAKINNNPQDLSSVIRSEKKLQTRGHVEFFKDLTPEQQNIIVQSDARYFLPWRPIWNENSLTTPCRLTFDASDKTDTGVSLNDILPKGINQINSLLEIIIAWRSGRYAMASDIEQMYNGIKLNEKHWSLQMYLWNDELKVGVEPELKIVKTVTYGVRSSSNQAITGVKCVAEYSKDEYPEAFETLTKQIYVDDILPAAKNTLEQCYTLADKLNVVVERGGLKLKSFAFTSIPPEQSLSLNGCSVDIAGMKWDTVTDELSLNVGSLNFSKRYRGKKPDLPECFKIPSKLTRRICTSVVGEIWDLIGEIVPVTARFKLDLHDLVIRKLNWDDEIPGELRKLWIENFNLIKELREVRFTRATVPPDAVDLKMELIEAADASSSLICGGIYARFKKKSGEYSCELVVGKSKIVPSGMTIPRAELYAAEINSVLGQLVMRALGDKVIKRYKITDNKVALYWIHAWEKPLKIWTRNRVNEILRWSNLDDWYWCPSAEMPCDIGTRRNATINDVGNDSAWKQGLEWMSKDSSTFPLKTMKEIKLEVEEKVAYDREITVNSHAFPVHSKGSTKVIRERIEDRLKFSNYLLHPNKYRFRSVVRIMGLVFHFLLKISVNLKRHIFNLNGNYQNFKHFPVTKRNATNNITLVDCDSTGPVTTTKVSSLTTEFLKNCDLLEAQRSTIYANKISEEKELPVIILKDIEINLGLRYLYQKATNEVDKFGRHTKAFKNSTVVDGIRYYNGRLLPSQKFTSPELHPMSSVMTDLSSTTFCVPVVDQYSPIAWSLLYEIHWYDRLGKHSGVATTARMAKEYAYVAGAKEIAEIFRKSCVVCRSIAKRTIEVGFGPMSEYQLNLAPAFYVTQVDLMGPFKAYQINVRATLKIWFAVFVCVVTSTVDIQVMEFYSSGSFIAAFIRFASRNGYPKVMLPDQGSNLESAIHNVEIDWIDVKGRLHKSYGVDFQTCGVGGHHQHGKVERKIRHIKETFLKTLKNERISVLQWQTVAAETANCINNLPIGTGSSRNINLELDDLDIITPNRLRFGRNNERSPLGPAYISHDPFKFMDINQKIFESWWEHWLISAAPELIEKPVNWKGGDNVKEGDVVLFRKCEGAVGSGTYQYGIVQTIHPSKDNVIRNVVVRYRNADEGKDRETKRAVKSLILIHKIDELNIIKEMADASQYVDKLFRQ